MSYMSDMNEIFTAFYNQIDNANIKNLREIDINLKSVAITDYVPPEKCPLVTIVKDTITGGAIETDQPSLSKPSNLRVEVGIVDHCQTELDYANTLTEDLIDKIIQALADNPELDGKSKLIILTDIEFDYDKRNGVFFSEPTMKFEIPGSELY